ncbi:MAG: S41 family peptidase [Siphonobacter sp.]
MNFARVFAFLIILGGGIMACKKNDETASKDIRDSVYYKTQQYYLWTDNLPSASSFNPTSYDSPEAVMEKVRTYSPVGSSGSNVDRWSFAISKETWDAYSSGTGSDFGIGFAWAATNDLRIAYAYKNSDAGTNGVARGWQVVSINSVAATNDNVDALNTALDGNSVVMVFTKPDGTQQTLTLTKTSYQTNPVLHKSIITKGSTKIGYIVLNSFLGDTAEDELNEAFSYFKSNGVTELVFDERYNGGGYVDLAEKVANLIAPTSAAGKVMYQDTHNSYLSSWNETISFDASLPSNNLNLSQVIFITTGSTASASELLINILKPYVTVKIVGETTYGKPVGYYAVSVMDYYTFPVAVKQVNAEGTGDYYDGFTADRTETDDVTVDWGDTSEDCLSDALTYITTGAFPASTGGRLATNLKVSNQKLQNKNHFVGAIFAR